MINFVSCSAVWVFGFTFNLQSELLTRKSSSGKPQEATACTITCPSITFLGGGGGGWLYTIQSWMLWGGGYLIHLVLDGEYPWVSTPTWDWAQSLGHPSSKKNMGPVEVLWVGDGVPPIGMNRMKILPSLVLRMRAVTTEQHNLIDFFATVKSTSEIFLKH